ncbi:MAG: alanine:cation symporter family protein [Clostridium fessum]
MIAIVIVLIGSVASLGIVWDTADVLMGLMAVINVPIIFLIAKPALPLPGRLPGCEAGWEESGL